jgi:hypothetical protein
MRQETPNADPRLPSVGLAAWVTVELDALLATGLVEADDLAPLSPAGLTRLASASARSARQNFDPQAALVAAADTRTRRMPV